MSLLERRGKMTAIMLSEESGEERRVIKNALRRLMKKEKVQKISNLSDMRCPYYMVIKHEG
jgi:hypothetical protein